MKILRKSHHLCQNDVIKLISYWAWGLQIYNRTVTSWVCGVFKEMAVTKQHETSKKTL